MSVEIISLYDFTFVGLDVADETSGICEQFFASLAFQTLLLSMCLLIVNDDVGEVRGNLQCQRDDPAHPHS